MKFALVATSLILSAYVAHANEPVAVPAENTQAQVQEVKTDSKVESKKVEKHGKHGKKAKKEQGK